MGSSSQLSPKGEVGGGWRCSLFLDYRHSSGPWTWCESTHCVSLGTGGLAPKVGGDDSDEELQDGEDGQHSKVAPAHILGTQTQVKSNREFGPKIMPRQEAEVALGPGFLTPALPAPSFLPGLISLLLTPDLGVGLWCQYTQEVYRSSRLCKTPRIADNWVFPSSGCSPYLSGFSTLRDICQHTQLVTPKSMRRMAVPAKAAMALRMLVPRLLLTCGRKRGTKKRQRGERTGVPAHCPASCTLPFLAPGVGVMSPARLDFPLSLFFFFSIPGTPGRGPHASLCFFCPLGSCWGGGLALFKAFLGQACSRCSPPHPSCTPLPPGPGPHSETSWRLFWGTLPASAPSECL